MKQKQVKATANGAKNAKTNKKEVPPKKVQEVVEENDEEEEEEVVTKKAAAAKKPAKKPANKKGAKAQKVEEEPEPEEEVEEEEQENDEDEVMEDEDDEQQEEDAEEDDEDEEAGDDEEEDPTIPSQVKSGEIPSTVLNSKVIHISKLPKTCKVNDVVKVFQKYGKIDQIHMVTAADGSYVNLAYKTTDAAKAAVADDNKVKVLNAVVCVKLQKEKNNKTYTGLHIRNLVHKTSEEQLKEHFKACGEIEQVKVVEKAKKTFAFVVFKDEASEAEALKLHNSVLNGVNIIVVKNDPSFSEAKWVDRYEENRTVVVKNKQSFENLDSEKVNKLQEVFAKYGEIERMDVLCREHTLAMVIYKNEADAQKAFELNNTTVNDFEIELQSFEKKGFINNNTTIFVSNLPNNCTEKDLRYIFSKAGEITSVLLKHGCATIRFADIDSYCRSFVYNESIINRKMIFVEPYSIRKHLKMKSKKTGKGFKRGAGKGNQGPKAKKPKTK